MVALSGQRVELTGFLLPLDGATVMLWPRIPEGHDTEPNINEMVRLTLPVEYYTAKEVRVQGEFHVRANRMDGYCVDVYQMRVEHLDLLR